MRLSEKHETEVGGVVAAVVVALAFIGPEAIFCAAVYQCWQMTHSFGDALLMIAAAPLASLLVIVLTAPLWVPFANGVMAAFEMVCMCVGDAESKRQPPLI